MPTLQTDNPITLRTPSSDDGPAVWELIRECKPLDENSRYCNLIQCDHFSETCVLAEMDGDVVGWISGYIVPDEPDTLFIWQVAVSEKARGQGLGRRMLNELVKRDICNGVDRIRTTITKDNDASWGLFTRFAEKKGAELDSEAHFKKDDHFDGNQSTEHMVTITLAEALEAAA
ncbi:diaminobutyrate acetyltransferase [Tranquillimonas rosea]|uniref:L-2,4-diaminobutyric acid acetyltransferase n=1 Tax=Tranquillimonas rosea TaxID=641238 RepID=A0A1H9V221_9RHOB|nr:diaminobutyrate acetyltransferase [Tranquillimonas rosea]SES15629.1 diaminobutyrate acetyltransferase [Tranquillimonas rosea]